MGLLKRIFGTRRSTDNALPGPHLMWMQIHDGCTWHVVEETHVDRATAQGRQRIWQEHAAMNGWTVGMSLVKPVGNAGTSPGDASYGALGGEAPAYVKVVAG